MLRKRAAALIAAALLFAASGCGGLKTPTKAGFVERAEALCTRMHTDAVTLFKNALAQRSEQHLSEAEFRAHLAPNARDLRQRQLEELGALQPPDALKATFEQWQQALRQELKQGLGPLIVDHGTGVKLIAFEKRKEQYQSRLGIRQDCA